MTRRIVFAGGVQAKALAKAYRLDVADGRDEDVFFIGAESMAREAAHRVIAAADVVVTEMGEHGDTVPDNLVPGRAVLVGLPLVCADFLWPFAGRPHPSNRPTEALADGPYPDDFGDSHLDSLLAKGTPPEEAVQEYLATDVAGLVDLDGMLADRLRLQAALDTRAGTDLALLIEARFRGRPLFASRHRLHLDLFRHVAAHVFDRVGADPARAFKLNETYFPPGEMPIHPSVLRHFGITAPLADHRYPVLDEGDFTFEEYCYRYINYTWNERLHEALALAEISPSDAIPALRQALEGSPGSRAGQAALARAERAVSDLSMLPPPAGLDEQGPASSRALALAAPPPAPANPEPAQTGALVAAQAAAWPTEADTRPMLSGGSWSAPVRQAAGAGQISDPALPTVTIPTTLIPGTAGTGPEPQAYVELPLSYNGHDVPAVVEAPPQAPDRYTPLPPAHDLIEVLPRMLAGTRGLPGADDGPFATMAETMPPPPLRPVLPPEIPAEPARRGLLAKLFGGGG